MKVKATDAIKALQAAHWNHWQVGQVMNPDDGLHTFPTNEIELDLSLPDDVVEFLNQFVGGQLSISYEAEKLLRKYGLL